MLGPKAIWKRIGMGTLLAVLLVGTASAALIGAYVTASGDAEVQRPITYASDAQYNDSVTYQSATSARLDLENNSFTGGFTTNETFAIKNTGAKTDTVTLVLKVSGPGIPDNYYQDPPMRVSQVNGLSVSYEVTGDLNKTHEASVSQVTLDPGQSARLRLTLTSDPALKPGHYDFKLFVRPA